jgi:hypothetical protein
VVGASVWVLGDLGYLLYLVAARSLHLIGLVWLATMLAIVAAAALVVSVHRKAVSARGLLRPAPLAAGAAGGALVVTAVVSVEFAMRDYLLAFAAAIVFFASAMVIRPRRLGAAVLIGAIGASVLWLIPDIVDDGTFEESPIAMTVTTGLLVAGAATAAWLAKRPDPAG